MPDRAPGPHFWVTESTVDVLTWVVGCLTCTPAKESQTMFWCGGGQTLQQMGEIMAAHAYDYHGAVDIEIDE